MYGLKYGIVMEAVPESENPDFEYITNTLFSGNSNILKDNISNNSIRNLIHVTYPPTRYFWLLIFGFKLAQGSENS